MIVKKCTIGSAVVVAVLFIISAVLFNWVISGQSVVGVEIKLPLLAIAGVVALLASLAFVSVAFAWLGLTDTSQALALPEGSIRAVIALSLIVLFAIMTIFLYGNLSQTGIRTAHHLALDQVEAWKAVAAKSDMKIVPVPEEGDATKFTVYYSEPRSQASEDLAKQLVILIGTLVTSVTSFYFGSKATPQVNGGGDTRPSPPTLRSIISPVGPVESGPSRTISIDVSGDNLDLVKEMKLVLGSKQILGEQLTSNASLVKALFVIEEGMTLGHWDIVATDGGGRSARLPGGFVLK